MRLYREINKVAQPHGALFYRRRQQVPTPVKFRELTAALKNASARGRRHHLTIDYNGARMVDIDMTGAEPLRLSFDPPVVIARGEAEFLVNCSGFDANEVIAADITVDFSLMLFG